MAKMSGQDRDSVAHKVQSIHYLAPYRKCLLTSVPVGKTDNHYLYIQHGTGQRKERKIKQNKVNNRVTGRGDNKRQSQDVEVQGRALYKEGKGLE